MSHLETQEFVFTSHVAAWDDAAVTGIDGARVADEVVRPRPSADDVTWERRRGMAWPRDIHDSGDDSHSAPFHPLNASRAPDTERSGLRHMSMSPAACTDEAGPLRFTRWSKEKARAFGNKAQAGLTKELEPSTHISETKLTNDGTHARIHGNESPPTVQKNVCLKRGGSETRHVPPRKRPRLKHAKETLRNPPGREQLLAPPPPPREDPARRAGGPADAATASETDEHTPPSRKLRRESQPASPPRPAAGAPDPADGRRVAQGVPVPRRSRPQPAQTHDQNWSTALAAAGGGAGDGPVGAAGGARRVEKPRVQPAAGARPPGQSLLRRRPARQALFDGRGTLQFMPSRKAAAGTRMAAVRVNRNGQPASSYCHVCSGKAAAGARVVCGNFGRTACKKVFCPSCAATFTGRRAAQLERQGWICTHCTGSCPRSASCKTASRRYGKSACVGRK